MNNLGKRGTAQVKPSPEKLRKSAGKKTHAIEHSLTLGGRSWAYCGKDTNKEEFLIAPEGTEPTCGTCKTHPEYQRLKAVRNYKARQTMRLASETSQAG